MIVNGRVEELHHLVRDIKKPTQIVEDVVESVIINKNILVLLVHILPPERENVYMMLGRWLVTKSPTKERNWNRQNEIPQNPSQNLQE